MLRKLNLDGDGRADLVNYGGPHRAAYAYRGRLAGAAGDGEAGGAG